MNKCPMRAKLLAVLTWMLLLRLKERKIKCLRHAAKLNSFALKMLMMFMRFTIMKIYACKASFAFLKSHQGILTWITV